MTQFELLISLKNYTIKNIREVDYNEPNSYFGDTVESFELVLENIDTKETKIVKMSSAQYYADFSWIKLNNCIS